MSVVSVSQILNGTKRSEDFNSLQYVRVFEAITSSETADETWAISNTVGVPVKGDQHPQDSYVRCSDVDISWDKGRRWVVTATYTHESDMREDPTSRPAKITFGHAQYQKALWKSYASSGADPQGVPSIPIVNSAKDIFADTVAVEEANLTIRIDRNQSSFSGDDARLYINTVNSGSITIAGVTVASRKAKMRQFSGIKNWDQNGSTYWEVTYEIEIDNKNHLLKILDQGFKYLNGLGKLVPVVDDEGVPTNTPRNLDGAGALLASGSDPVTKEFHVFFEKDWSGLSLPTST